VGLPGLRLSLNCGWSSIDPKDEPWYLLTPFRAGKDNLERYSRRFSEGKRGEIDRTNRPHLSLFQFAIRYLKRLLARREPLLQKSDLSPL
jgi:hypothetical protein